MNAPPYAASCPSAPRWENRFGAGGKCRQFGTCRHPGIGTHRPPDRIFNGFNELWFGQELALRDSGPKPMMKIEIQETGESVVLRVEGRLAGAFVPELENCWRTAQSTQPKRSISVDLKSVTCVDRAGRYLLQLMHLSGVPFLRPGLAVQDILEQIREQPECRH
jgi:hypothetical protein